MTTAADDGDSSTWVLYVWLFVQIQVIFALLYFIVRIVVCPLCCGRRADPPPLSADAVRRNFEELRARAESKRADRAARIATRLAALAAPVAELAGMESAAALRRFRDAVAAHTLCPFARKAVVWADPLPRSIGDDDDVPLDAEAVAAVPIFARWSLTAFASKLDGFLLARQLPRDRFLDADDDAAPPSPAQIASGHVLLYNLSLWLRVSLHTLSLSDPGGDGRSCIVNDDDDDAEFYAPTGRRGWRFRFADEAFFITLFAPAYGPEHPRHCTGDWSFILLQPDFSFSLTHNVGLDHPSMPPDAPPDTWTMRERVRRRFLAANRMYYVPIAHAFPQATLYIPHHDAALAEDGWHWQWWLDQPSIAQGGDRKLRAAAATAAEAKSNQTKTKPKTN